MRNSKWKMQKACRATLYLHFAFCILHFDAVSAQQLLDRVVARVDGAVITLTDVQAAVGLGIVEANDVATGTQRTIDRQLMLAEVARFPPPDPTDAALDAEAAAMRARAGANLPSIMRTTGVDDARLREIARDTLRIQGYLRQRFGQAAQLSTTEVRQWLVEVRGRAEVIVNSALNADR